MNNKKYYIYSHKWTSGYIRTFWGKFGCGYTIDLNKAGLYDRNYRKDEYPVINTKKELLKLITSKYGKSMSCKIHKDKIEKVLGKKMCCVLN